MKRIFSNILLLVTATLLFAAARPSLDGRAVVANKGEMPVGLFAKTVGYLPGDSVSVTNPTSGMTIEVLILGAIDPSEGIAILLSPEAAEKLGIKKDSNIQVKITKRTGQLDEAVTGQAILAHNDGTLDEIPAATTDENKAEATTAPVADSGYAIEDHVDTADNFEADKKEIENTSPIETKENDEVAQTPQEPVSAEDSDFGNLSYVVKDDTAIASTEAAPAAEVAPQTPAIAEASTEPAATEAPVEEAALEPVAEELPPDTAAPAAPVENTTSPVEETAAPSEQASTEPAASEPVATDTPVEEASLEPVNEELPPAEATPAESTDIIETPAETKPAETTPVEETPAVEEPVTSEPVEAEELPLDEPLPETVAPEAEKPAPEEKATTPEPATDEPIASEPVEETAPAEPVEAEPVDETAPAAEVAPATVPEVEQTNPNEPEADLEETKAAPSDTTPVESEPIASEPVDESLEPLETVAPTETAPTVESTPVAQTVAPTETAPVASSEPVEESIPAEEPEPVEEATPAPVEDTSADEAYKPIVLVPTESVAPKAAETKVTNEITSIPEVSTEPEVVETPKVTVPITTPAANTISPAATTVAPTTNAPAEIKKHAVSSVSDLNKEKYYIQIASLANEDNIINLLKKYNKYPIILVPRTGANGYQVLVGPLTVDEYGTILEKFKAFGFKDAFIKKIK